MARRTDKGQSPRLIRAIRPGSGQGGGKAAKPKRKKKSSPIGRAAFALLVTAAVLALAFFLMVRDQGNISLAENTVGSIFAPIQNALSSATRYVRDLVQGAKDYVRMGQELELAQQENATLKLQVQALEEEALENERLKELLEAKERYESMDPVFAYVIARDPGIWYNTFSINRGTQDGIQVDMAVVTGDGLVGRVMEVGLNYAKVLSIIDTRSGVACLIERSRQQGVMRGQVTDESQTQECYMYHLPKVNNIAPGDVVLTSGEDAVFPKGLKVGTVASVSRQSGLSDQYIVVVPSVDFQHIEEVLVLRTAPVDSGEALEPLPTPTPRPTPEPTPTPTPSGEEGQEVDPDDQNWYYPTPRSTQAEDLDVQASPTPSPTPDPNAPPEDAWVG